MTERWYHRPWCLSIALLLGGPLALPLVWTAPQLARWAKWLISIVVMALTVWLVSGSVAIAVALIKRLQLQGVL